MPFAPLLAAHAASAERGMRGRYNCCELPAQRKTERRAKGERWVFLSSRHFSASVRGKMCECLRAFPFTRHPEPSRRFYTSSRSGARVHTSSRSGARVYTSSRSGARVYTSSRSGTQAARDLPVCYSLSLARGFLASLTSPLWGSCAVSSKCSCKQAFLLASGGMAKRGRRALCGVVPCAASVTVFAHNGKNLSSPRAHTTLWWCA